MCSHKGTRRPWCFCVEIWCPDDSPARCPASGEGPPQHAAAPPAGDLQPAQLHMDLSVVPVKQFNVEVLKTIEKYVQVSIEPGCFQTVIPERQLLPRARTWPQLYGCQATCSFIDVHNTLRSGQDGGWPPPWVASWGERQDQGRSAFWAFRGTSLKACRSGGRGRVLFEGFYFKGGEGRSNLCVPGSRSGVLDEKVNSEVKIVT